MAGKLNTQRVLRSMLEQTGAKKDWFTTGTGYQEEHARYENTLTDASKLRRRLFAAHYIKTADPKASAEFAGFKKSTAFNKGKKLLHEPYVQFLLDEMMEAAGTEAIISHREILFRLKQEANDMENGNQAGRVSALATLAKIKGMVGERQDQKVTNNGGVMVVPQMGSVDDWEQAASKSQQVLQQTVRD